MEEIVKEMNIFLSDLACFYRKLQNYHWNIIGEDFFEVHVKLEEYYNEINEQIDEIAEHILTLGYEPLGTMEDYIANKTIAEAKNEKVKSKEIFENLIEDYTILLQESTKIKKIADEKNNYSTSSLIDEYIKAYSKKLWMLKSCTMSN